LSPPMLRVVAPTFKLVSMRKADINKEMVTT
jgi:hypothetical protein